MSDYNFPPDLLELQRAFFAADARCEDIAATHPRAVDIAAGEAALSEDQREKLEQARAERLRLVEALQDHGWWSTVAGVQAARAELRKAARGGSGD